MHPYGLQMTSDKPALTASTEWPERVYELQKTDPVDAGADGIDNLAPNQLAARTNYLRVKGISDWAAVWNYPNGAFCQEAGVVYRAVTANAGKPPASNPAIWTRCPMTAAEIADAINLSDKQPVDATLTALAGLNTSADRLIYATGADQFALTPLTAFIRTLLDDADAATARATLGAAPLASPALTDTPTTPTAADGTNTAQIASTAFVQSAVGGYLSKSVTGGTVTLSDLEASNPVIGFSGTLTSNLVVVVPTTVKRLWAINNATSGAFTLTVKTATGSGVTVAQGKRNLVYTDGTNVYDGFNDFENIALTGVPTAPTAATGTNTTQVATTAFVNAEIAADRPFEATLANIKMDGAQSVGSLNTVARGDQVHPTDTSRAPLASPALTGIPTAPTASTGTRSTQLATTAFVGAESQIAAPTGSVYTFAGSTVPTGWLKCNGALLSRTTYASLFAVIGTTYGAGDGSTTFALPDLRGEFVRGADDGRGVDAGRVLGSAQAGQNASHTHTASTSPAGGHNHVFENVARMPDQDRGIGNASLWSIDSTVTQTTSVVGDHIHAVTVNADGGNESRPRNVAMHYIIKY